MEVHLLRVESIKDGKPFWLLADHGHKLHGRKGENRQSLINRWTSLYGKPTKIFRYKGIMRTSEASMTLVDIQGPKGIKK